MMDHRTPSRRIDADEFLRSVPHANRAMELRRLEGGEALAEVPMQRPGWLVPPVSWVVPFSSTRRVRLDAVGAEVLAECDGRASVERIIEKFASRHKLSFREAQLPVTQFLQQMTQRGLIAIVGSQERASGS